MKRTLPKQRERQKKGEANASKPHGRGIKVNGPHNEPEKPQINGTHLITKYRFYGRVVSESSHFRTTLVLKIESNAISVMPIEFVLFNRQVILACFVSA